MNKNVPKLRFKDDNGLDYPEWEEKKLGDIVICLDNKRKPLNSESRNNKKGNIPYYGANGIVDYINEYIFDEELILLAEDGGNFDDFANKPIAQIINGKSWVNNHAHVLKSNNQCLKYIFYTLVHKDIRRYINGTSRAKLNKSDMLEIKIQLPVLEEQERIGNFFDILDKLIEEQDRKVIDLKLYKKGIMQKIFKQEIRFKDDNGLDYPEWEKKKLNYLFKITAGGDIKREHISEVRNNIFKYPIYSNSLTEKGLYGYSDTYKVDGDSITVTGRGSLGYAIARYEQYYPIVRLLVLKPLNLDTCNVKFFEEVINNIKIFVESTGVPQLTAPQLGGIKVIYPYLEEQTKIAKFLFNIDKLIEEEQKNLDDLREMKKGLLQQMFV